MEFKKEDCLLLKKGDICILDFLEDELVAFKEGRYKYSDYYCACTSHWLPYLEQKTFATLEIGDYVFFNNPKGIITKVIDFSQNKKLVYVNGDWYGEPEFNYNFSIPSPVKLVLSKKDIAEKFGVDEDNLEIK